MELEIVQASIPRKSWREYKVSGQELQQLGNSLPAVIVRNTARLPVVCGDFVLHQRSPVPWVWSRITRPFSTRGQAVRVEVLCDE